MFGRVPLRGFEVLADRGVVAAPDVADLVTVGFSLGALPAQKLAQTRPGVRAAVLCHSAIPLGVFAPEWPPDVALLVQMCVDDPWVQEDLPAARELVDAAADGELVLDPGARHLVADPTRVDHDPVLGAAVLDRTIRLLDRVDDGDRRDADGRPEPRQAAGELTTLLGFLEYQRATLGWKCDGIDAGGLRTRVGASPLTLGGLRKHMALVETNWFRRRLHGEGRRPPFDAVDWSTQPDWDFDSAASDEPDVLAALWQAAIAEARWGIVMALADRGLDQPTVMTWPDGSAPTLRWVLVHMIEEYARHNGHADLLREAIDGATGE